MLFLLLFMVTVALGVPGALARGRERRAGAHQDRVEHHTPGPSPNKETPAGAGRRGLLTSHRRPYNEGALDAVLTRLKTSRAAYRLRHRMISRRVLPSWVRRS